MNEEIEVYLPDTGSSSYVESLTNALIKLHKVYNIESKLVKTTEAVLLAELELALLGAEKARSEILKATKDNIKPIK